MAPTRKGKMFVYSKQIKTKEIDNNVVTRTADKERFESVILSLKQIGKVKPLDQFDLKENCVQWVNDVLSGFSNTDTTKDANLKYLLNDFSSSMMTRMREEDKYALAIVSDKFLLLCHTTMGEQTITPVCDVVDRMLDKDNVERFVIFTKQDEITNVIYYEHSPSEFFIRWLGITQKEAFAYLGGKNRIYGALDGIHYVLELTDDEIDSQILKDTGAFNRDNNQLFLKTPIEVIDIRQIRVGKKQYTNMPDFLQDYLARRYELDFYQEAYQKISESLDPLMHTYIDDFDAVITVSNKNDEIKVKKRNAKIQILFAGRTKTSIDIQFRESFFARIFSDYKNGVDIRIFHAGMKIFDQDVGSFKIGSMEIFNEIQSHPTIDELLELNKNTDIRDAVLSNSLQYAIFQLLNQYNADKPIALFFSKFAQAFGKNIKNPKKVTQNEGDVIEFKSRDFLVGKDIEIINRIADDIDTKIREQPFKIYLFGVDEKTNKVEPMTTRKFGSDRIGGIEKALIKKCNNIVKISLVKIPLNQGEECLFFMPVKLDETV